MVDHVAGLGQDQRWLWVGVSCVFWGSSRGSCSCGGRMNPDRPRPLILSCCLFSCHLSSHLVLCHPSGFYGCLGNCQRPREHQPCPQGNCVLAFFLPVFQSINCQLPLEQVIINTPNFHKHLLFLNHKMRVVSSAGRDRCFFAFHWLSNVGRKFKRKSSLQHVCICLVSMFGV